jgi:hypothetical protein
MRTVAVRLAAFAVLLCSIAGAQHSNWDPLLAQKTQEQGYWANPSTGLMWTARDSKKRMSWHKAAKYCRALRELDYSDWRLASIEELEGLVNLQAYATEHVGSSDIFHWNGDLHVNGGLQLEGDRHWSSTQVSDPNIQISKSHYWAFDYREGKRMSGFEDWAEGDTMFALCVRDTHQKQTPSQSN